MSSGYIGISLREILSSNELGEKFAKELLSEFYCPLNKDVDDFLKEKSIVFENQGISRTYLIMASYREKYVLCGYFTLANKFIAVYRDSLKSRSIQKRLSKFSQYDAGLKRYTLSAPLIGQIGKNYNHDYNKLITGDELLKLAIDKIREMQYIVGGKILYLECEDKERLVEFYTRNGFVNFGKRNLERDEVDVMEGKYLLQMLKYIH